MHDCALSKRGTPVAYESSATTVLGVEPGLEDPIVMVVMVKIIDYYVVPDSETPQVTLV